MKKLFKNKKLSIIAIASVILLSAAIALIFTSRTVEPHTASTTEPQNVETKDNIKIDIPIEPTINDTTENEPEITDEIIDDGHSLKPGESIAEDNSASTDHKTTTSKKKFESSEKAVESLDLSKTVETDTPKSDASSSTEHIIGNQPISEKYTCGSPNHHCQNAEYHASLLNRELDGCPYCGSHSCPSFYAINEWGYTAYNPSLCPKYSVQSDKAKVCPICGREMWSKDNQTGCFSYLQDTLCECGELVPANTCHHH